MEVIYLLLLVGAVLCFAVAAFSVAHAAPGNPPRRATRVNLLALGLLLWVLVDLIKLLVGFEV